jgi:hypothetical protein
MQTLLQDLRYATRQLIRNLGLTITAVVSLALGIGATTAVFSVIYATLMNPYPYPAADRIVRLTVHSKANSSDEISLNGPQIKQLQQLHSVEGVLAMDYDAMNLTGHDLPENVNTISLISNGFQDLGVPPIVGRELLPSDAPDGQEPQPVVVQYLGAHYCDQNGKFRHTAGTPSGLAISHAAQSPIALFQRKKIPTTRRTAHSETREKIRLNARCSKLRTKMVGPRGGSKLSGLRELRRRLPAFPGIASDPPSHPATSCAYPRSLTAKLLAPALKASAVVAFEMSPPSTTMRSLPEPSSWRKVSA